MIFKRYVSTEKRKIKTKIFKTLLDDAMDKAKEGLNFLRWDNEALWK